jgi:hypothetical protein
MEIIKIVNVFNVLYPDVTMDASKKNVATDILVFDFDLFIGGRHHLLCQGFDFLSPT